MDPRFHGGDDLDGVTAMAKATVVAARQAMALERMAADQAELMAMVARLERKVDRLAGKRAGLKPAPTGSEGDDGDADG